MCFSKKSLYILSFFIIIQCCVFVSCKSNNKSSNLATILRKYDEFANSSHLEVQPIDIDGTEYFVITKSKNWEYSVYHATIKNNEIKDAREIEDISGVILNYKELTLNRNPYWQFDVANHQGNGTSYFYNVKDKKIAYKIEGTVDFHHEGSLSADFIKKSGFDTKGLVFDKKHKAYRYSIIYNQKLLESCVKDMNNDSYDDLVFYGTRFLVESFDKTKYSNTRPIQNSYLEQIYFFDVETDAFISE